MWESIPSWCNSIDALCMVNTRTFDPKDGLSCQHTLIGARDEKHSSSRYHIFTWYRSRRQIIMPSRTRALCENLIRSEFQFLLSEVLKYRFPLSVFFSAIVSLRGSTEHPPQAHPPVNTALRRARPNPWREVTLIWRSGVPNPKPCTPNPEPSTPNLES